MAQSAGAPRHPRPVSPSRSLSAPGSSPPRAGRNPPAPRRVWPGSRSSSSRSRIACLARKSSYPSRPIRTSRSAPESLPTHRPPHVMRSRPQPTPRRGPSFSPFTPWPINTCSRARARAGLLHRRGTAAMGAVAPSMWRTTPRRAGRSRRRAASGRGAPTPALRLPRGELARRHGEGLSTPLESQPP